MEIYVSKSLHVSWQTIYVQERSFFTCINLGRYHQWFSVAATTCDIYDIILRSIKLLLSRPLIWQTIYLYEYITCLLAASALVSASDAIDCAFSRSAFVDKRFSSICDTKKRVRHRYLCTRSHKIRANTMCCQIIYYRCPLRI